MKVVVFCTDEGFGHTIRLSAVLNALRKDTFLDVTIACSDRVKTIFDEKLTFNFKHRLYVSALRSIKDPEGGVDLLATKQLLLCYAEISDAEQGKIEQIICEAKAQVVLSDFVPNVFPICNTLAIPSFGLAHFTWDWFLLQMGCSRTDPVFQKYIHDVNEASKLFFPPMSPDGQLANFNQQLVEQCKFIVSKFVPIPENNLIEARPNKSELVCLLMDNGTNYLHDVITKVVEQTKLQKKSPITFAVNSDRFHKTADQHHILWLDGIHMTHSFIPYCDILIARAGFNTVSEVLCLKKFAILHRESRNPEVEFNFSKCVDGGFAVPLEVNDLIYDPSNYCVDVFRSNSDQVTSNLKLANFEKGGEFEIASKILQST